MPGATGSCCEESVGPSDGRIDVNVVLKAVSTALSIDVTAFGNIELVAKGHDCAIEITDLGLEEDQLLSLKH